MIGNKEMHEIFNSSEKVMIKFWAPWCGPCKPLGFTLDKMMDEESSISSFKVVSVNVDEVEPGTMQVISVKTIPSLLFVEDGLTMGRLVGNQPQTAIEALIKELENEV